MGWVVINQVSHRGRSPFSGQAAVDTGQMAVPPQGKVQIGDITETDQGFGVGSNGVEVDAVGDAVSAGTAPGGDHRTNSGVTEGVVEVVESVVVVAGHVAPLVECVVADLDGQAPALQDLAALEDPLSSGEAGWGDETNTIAGAHPRREQDAVIKALDVGHTAIFAAPALRGQTGRPVHAAGIDPAPRRQCPTWRQFLAAQAGLV